MAEIPWDQLVRAAAAVRDNAYAPYSGYRVGAALLDSDGRIWPGCNVENASYGLTLCAERVALTTAVAHGVKSFIALALVTASSPPATPCGACRQVLREFAERLPILCVNERGEELWTDLEELLPRSFGGGDLT
jgi:cytidine deaminase